MNDLKTVRDALEGVRNCYKTHSKISSGLWDYEIKPAIAMLDRMIETCVQTETLATESEQLRKERDELAKEVVYLNAVCGNCVEVKYLLKTINLAKKVIENGNA